MKEERKGSPFSWAAVACGVAALMAYGLPLLVVAYPVTPGAGAGDAAFVLELAGSICAGVGYRRRERMRHWGWVAIVAGLLLLVAMLAMGVMLRRAVGAVGAGSLVGLWLVWLEGTRKKREGSPFSWAAVACGVMGLVFVWLVLAVAWRWAGDFNALAAIPLMVSAIAVGIAGIICMVVGYGRTEEMRHWGWVGIAAALCWLLVVAFIVL